uniref:AP2/ERF domain-containing protein n=1 Tax=Odontella aurita TaxID=265563 RepID=A0A7S4J8Y5_9STRA
MDEAVSDPAPSSASAAAAVLPIPSPGGAVTPGGIPAVGAGTPINYSRVFESPRLPPPSSGSKHHVGGGGAGSTQLLRSIPLLGNEALTPHGGGLTLGDLSGGLMGGAGEGRRTPRRSSCPALGTPSAVSASGAAMTGAGESAAKGTGLTPGSARTLSHLDVVHMAERDLMEDEDLSVLLQLAASTPGKGTPVFRSPRLQQKAVAAAAATMDTAPSSLQLPIIGRENTDTSNCAVSLSGGSRRTSKLARKSSYPPHSDCSDLGSSPHHTHHHGCRQDKAVYRLHPHHTTPPPHLVIHASSGGGGGSVSSHFHPPPPVLPSTSAAAAALFEGLPPEVPSSSRPPQPQGFQAQPPNSAKMSKKSSNGTAASRAQSAVKAAKTPKAKKSSDAAGDNSSQGRSGHPTHPQHGYPLVPLPGMPYPPLPPPLPGAKGAGVPLAPPPGGYPHHLPYPLLPPPPGATGPPGSVSKNGAQAPPPRPGYYPPPPHMHHHLGPHGHPPPPYQMLPYPPPPPGHGHPHLPMYPSGGGNGDGRSSKSKKSSAAGRASSAPSAKKSKSPKQPKSSGGKRPVPAPSGGSSPSGGGKKKKGSPKKRAKSMASPALSPADRQRAADAIRKVNAASGGNNDRAAELAAAILRGVTMRPSGKWQAQLYYAGKSRYIGVFDTREKAALAYEIAREVLKSDASSSGKGGSKGDQSAQSLKDTEAAVNAARKAAFDGVNEKDPRK